MSRPQGRPILVEGIGPRHLPADQGKFDPDEPNHYDPQAEPSTMVVHRVCSLAVAALGPLPGAVCIFTPVAGAEHRP